MKRLPLFESKQVNEKFSSELSFDLIGEMPKFKKFSIVGEEINKKKFWVVYTFDGGTEFKSEVANGTLQKIFNTVIGSGMPYVIGRQVAGIFEDEKDARKLYDAINLPPEE